MVPALKYDDSDRQRIGIRGAEAPVDREDGVERAAGLGNQCSLLNAGPTHVANGRDIERQLSGKLPWHALVK